MADTPRLNSIIRLLEQRQIPITVFSPPAVESAIELATARYDGVVFEAELNPYDIRGLRDCLQYMLNRRQLFERQSLSPAVTPIVRIPANGGEMNHWIAQQGRDTS